MKNKESYQLELKSWRGALSFNKQGKVTKYSLGIIGEWTYNWKLWVTACVVRSCDPGDYECIGMSDCLRMWISSLPSHFSIHSNWLPASLFHRKSSGQGD